MKIKSFKIKKICLIKLTFLARRMLYYFSPLYTMRKEKDPDPVTDGSGCRSGRPKNIQKIQMRLRNTVLNL
jgi:hypothetical protein